MWLDFDHDYDEDLFLIGDDSRLLRNNGDAGFSDETKRFPFVTGRALDAVPFDLEPDTPGFDLVVSYQDRKGVLYRDQLGGSYRAIPLDALPAGATELSTADVNRDGRTDLAAAGLQLLNRPGGWQTGARAASVRGRPQSASRFRWRRAFGARVDRQRRFAQPGPQRSGGLRQLAGSVFGRRQEP